ncbi:hypothetical protein [Rubeoparvulum massiliense]|uniref:hypothetical protein n=1 Tax=Rubeoparvulum massiliense TaxID=1631346 RepID=UPI00065E5D40|nr:hypothetical protein [Rubeoparvulum massiliense]
MKKLVASVAAILMITTITGCSEHYSNKMSKTYDSLTLSSELPVVYDEGSFMVNIDNPEEIVGWGDYVFVAKVEDELRTEYTNVRKSEDGTITGKPYTVYSITVIDNLKGNLKKNKPIEFFKHGGVNYDGKSISLLKGDILLESRKYYILVAASEADGRLGQGMPNSAIELNVSNKQEIVSNKEYENYKKYVKDEVKFERERFKSLEEE